MVNFMLKVPCGVSGRVRIVRENSETGEVTGEFEFDNIWTDYGLENGLNSTITQARLWPNRILCGSGEHPQPHNVVTELAEYVGYGDASYSGVALVSEISITDETCVFTRTRSATQAARGVDWTLRELALSANNLLTYTYALTRNASGLVEGIPVSAIEVLTIYYTIQVCYPMVLPAQPVEVEGLPPTMATFKLKPTGSPGSNDFLRDGPVFSNAGSRYINGYTDELFSGEIASDASVEGLRRFNTGTMNRSTKFFGNRWYCANHIWELDIPIVKNNTQVLYIGETWTFSNVPPVEV